MCVISYVNSDVPLASSVKSVRVTYVTPIYLLANKDSSESSSSKYLVHNFLNFLMRRPLYHYNFAWELHTLFFTSFFSISRKLNILSEHSILLWSNLIFSFYHFLFDFCLLLETMDTKSRNLLNCFLYYLHYYFER